MCILGQESRKDLAWNDGTVPARVSIYNKMCHFRVELQTVRWEHMLGWFSASQNTFILFVGRSAFGKPYLMLHLLGKSQEG